MKRPNYFRGVEFPVLAGFVKDSFVRDREDFEAFAPEFKNGFLKSIDKKVAELESLEDPLILTGELKKVTARLRDNVRSLRPILNRVEIFAKKGNGSMNVDYTDFGFKLVRDKISSGDVEGVIGALKIILKNLRANRERLETLGLNGTYARQFEKLTDEIFDDDVLQNKLLSNRRNAVVRMDEKRAELWDLIKQILDHGRAMYSIEDPVRARDYTISRLRARLRAERKQSEGEEQDVRNAALEAA